MVSSLNYDVQRLQIFFWTKNHDDIIYELNILIYIFSRQKTH